MEVAHIKVGLIGFLLGTVLGSLCLVLAERGLTDKSFWGRSYCPHCKKNLRWYDLFPVLSYIFLKGKCRYCHKKISIEYLVVEVVMGLLIGFLFWQEFSLELIYKTFFITILVSLFITDIKKMLIPDRIILPSILIGFVLSLVITIFKIGYLYYSLSSHDIGKYLLPAHSPYFFRHAYLISQPLLSGILMAILIGGFFWGLIVVTRGKGMGGGDVKLGAFIGLMLGFPQGLLAIIMSFVIGAIFSVCLLVTGKKHFGQTIPFGPFLVIGSLAALFWGGRIIDWYLNLSYT